MHSTGQYLQVFVPMFWLGMVIAISFIEAPIKFRAPGVTLAVGLGIGRLVFRALNTVEVVLAILVLLGCGMGTASTAGWVLAIIAAVVLAIQVAVIRPPLTKRSNRILAGEDAPRSQLHYYYIALEGLKVVVLLVLAVVLTSPVLT
ncbi:hypothetical protein FOS14_23120 [Skermania sp. ID1734]|uniref:hypothetical protein n=1 Tax=Skermania sp. ID1734 TaxID=2597516 RepID=UPI001180BE23|nr:hypothetical protein [Skermania sp. ID1734]TSD93446.1 hypothetical protein FOS14_23120 [Skermania sp. ID1734]